MSISKKSPSFADTFLLSSDLDLLGDLLTILNREGSYSLKFPEKC